MAWLFVQFANSDQIKQYYRAVYLTEYSVHDLLMKISENKLEPARVVRTLHATEAGQLIVDHSIVRELLLFYSH